MKCFCLDENDDVMIKNNKIQLIYDEELLKQKIQKLLNTNQGEWFSNENEGINFRNILKKGVDEETIKSEILDGLLQIDDTFIITYFNTDINTKSRELKVYFKAENSSGEKVDVDTEL